MPKFKLSLMMLLQYMMYAVWWVPLAAYLTRPEMGIPQKRLPVWNYRYRDFFRLL